MGKTLIWLLALVAGAALFFFMASSRDVIEPWLAQFGITLEGSKYLRAVVSLFALLLVVVPLRGFVRSLINLGSDAAGADIHGYTELRLKSGLRIFILIAVAGVMTIVGLAASDVQSLSGQMTFYAFGLFMLWAGIWVWTVRVRFDNSSLLVKDAIGRTHRHEWRDLDRAEANKQAMEYHLSFSTGKKARISFFFSGVEQLLDRAQQEVN